MTRICFLDTETTSLRHDRRAWEVGLIIREQGKADEEYHWFIDSCDLDLGNADLSSLRIGRYYDRHPDVLFAADPHACIQDAAGCRPESQVMMLAEQLTRGAHIVGAVPNFDTEVLAARMRAHGICPSWHYHLIDTEALAVGWLNGRRARQNEIVDGYPLENHGEHAPGLVRWIEPVKHGQPPWKSDDLSAALGIKISDEDRHTALGDARWARALFDAVTGGGNETR